MSAGRLDASAFVPDIDDDTLLVGEPADLVLEAGQRRLVHRADMDVGDFSFGDFIQKVSCMSRAG